ncbi:PIG-L family deacetylase [Mucilaginibacter sp. 5C4]|uniref:PIG-L deacetylase family protein n=1 Tax=Mucilaginibacter sp. 5C4 TaxID=3048589 RepID=UPI002AC961AE|nr:PIG-L family deacetylase [Mucilaginibacter sp. 5C4]MEB0302829.1 PIG-L family deacetylase [Mucilaginibacter sp. 5C4]WPX24115.1 PIG-L family deacetylase [Mucilaginibacter sp. 5C4]
MYQEKPKQVAIIVAHPDDETLWAGGTILSNPSWQCFVVCLCRKSDNDRAPKFFKALSVLGAKGAMGDLNDGPEQTPLSDNEIMEAILQLIPHVHFDLIITHNPNGEYTRHLRHEEISKTVVNLWNEGKLLTDELWTFAYEDGNKAYLPKADIHATCYRLLTQDLWDVKYNIITLTYGFDESSWEAKTTPNGEAFWHFSNPVFAKKWLANLGTAS